MARTVGLSSDRATSSATRRWKFAVERALHEPALEPGHVVDSRFRVVRLLGEGGMGRVYEAEQLALQRPVALKLLRTDLRYQTEHVERFRREARAASRIGHPNIVEILDCVHAPSGDLYMVMELLRGRSFENFLEETGPLAPAIEWLAQVCDALAAAHAVGVLHRDIKPANVFLSQSYDGRIVPKLLDFGIAKIVDDDGMMRTAAGVVLGTPHYLAPERTVQRDVGPAADVYSVAVMLYELLTGDVPFDGQNQLEIVAQHLRTAPLDPRQRAPHREWPEPLARLAMEGLAKDPCVRIASARLFAERLRECAHTFAASLARVQFQPTDRTADADALTHAVTIDAAAPTNTNADSSATDEMVWSADTVAAHVGLGGAATKLREVESAATRQAAIRSAPEDRAAPDLGLAKTKAAGHRGWADTRVATEQEVATPATSVTSASDTPSSAVTSTAPSWVAPQFNVRANERPSPVVTRSRWTIGVMAAAIVVGVAAGGWWAAKERPVAAPSETRATGHGSQSDKTAPSDPIGSDPRGPSTEATSISPRRAHSVDNRAETPSPGNGAANTRTPIAPEEGDKSDTRAASSPAAHRTPRRAEPRPARTQASAAEPSITPSADIPEVPTIKSDVYDD